MDHVRAPDADLPFRSLLPDDLEVIARRVSKAIKDYKQTAGADGDGIPWIGLPKTFWYWTSTMWHYNRSLVIMPAAVSEPATAEMVKVAVQIARSAQVKVSYS